jgi:precorrin-3B C17-methyltransferase
MSGSLAVVGLGPGDPDWITPETTAILAAAEEVLGYGPYLARLGPPRDGQRRHASDNREEIARARHALDLAAAGRRVAVVSGGDPGVFAMASAVFEAMEDGDPAWRALDVTVHPGVTAVLAAAARVGAPLGHDFCVVSLSENLKPWDLVLRRLDAAVAGDFVLALYNVASRARPWQLGAAFDRLRQAGRTGGTPVVLAAAVGRADERIVRATLADVDPAMADMRTLVLVGSSRTRCLARPDGRPPFVYTPRRVDPE